MPIPQLKRSMRISSLTLSLGSALVVAAGAAVGGFALKTAGAEPAGPATQPAPAGRAAPAAAEPEISSVVGNKPHPTAGPSVPAGPVELADRPFETVAGGIALRYPAGSKALR